MSKESASDFLAKAARDADLQACFSAVSNAQDFIKVAEEWGYSFTTEELREVIQEHSQGVTLRRKTGVWRWLRTVHWMDSMKSAPAEAQMQEA